MTVHTKPQTEDEAPPVWRLDDLFSGPEDPRVEQVLAEAASANDALVKLKGAFVAAREALTGWAA